MLRPILRERGCFGFSGTESTPQRASIDCRCSGCSSRQGESGKADAGVAPSDPIGANDRLTRKALSGDLNRGSGWNEFP